MASPFDAPIPGQSLTDEPGNAPWEKPAQYDTVEDTVKFYINMLADQDVMDDLAVMFDAGLTVKPFVKTMVQTGAMNGFHTVDVGLLIQPMLADFIKAAMGSYGINAKDESMSTKERATEREKQRTMTAIKLAMADSKSKGKTSENDAGVRMMEAMQTAEQGVPTEETAAPEATAMEQEQPAAPQGAGLMARSV